MATGTITTILATLLLAGTFTTQTAPGEAETVISGGTSRQVEMASWAVARYEAAGLDLPPLVIEFVGRDLAGCGGAPGRAYPRRTPAQVKLCWNDPILVLHELAHVWEAHNVAATDHEPFMAMRTGVESWVGADIAWVRQGREHAANVIAWGVLDEPRPVLRTYPNDPDSLRAAFEFLTGTEPLHDGGPPIAEPDREFFTGDRSNPALESGR